MTNKINTVFRRFFAFPSVCLLSSHNLIVHTSYILLQAIICRFYFSETNVEKT